MSIAVRCSSKPLLPAAYKAPTTLPALVPTTMSGTIPCASSALMTPMCAKPRAAPPPSASAILILRGGSGVAAAATGAAGGATGAEPQPVNAYAAKAARELSDKRRRREETSEMRMGPSKAM
jgi:hypothetical protein